MASPSEGSLRTVAAPRSGSSRVRSAKADRITSVVSGYSSTISFAEGLCVIYFVWVILGMGLVGAGLFGFTASSRQQYVDFDRAVLSIQAATMGLNFVTMIAWFAWLGPTWTNVGKLGKNAKVGYIRILFRHLAALPAMMIVFVMAMFAPALALFALLIMVMLYLYAQMLVPNMIYRTFEMLWEQSTLPGRGADAVPHFAVGWVVAWVLFSNGVYAITYLPGDVNSHGLIAILAGIAMIVCSFLAGKLSLAISVRQDARLLSIINEIQEDTGISKPEPEQLEDQWKASERLVEFDR